MQVLKEFKDDGSIKSVGVSELKAATLDRARKVCLLVHFALTISDGGFSAELMN
jgi:diketogulonate reductase-like aldo/keto reductase